MNQQDDRKISIPFENILKHSRFFNYKVLTIFISIVAYGAFILLINSQKKFEVNVYPKSAKEIRDIHSLKTRDGFLFIFNSDNENLNKIIDFNSMKKEKYLSEKLTYIIDRSVTTAKITYQKRHKFLWPKESKILQEMIIYSSDKMDKVLFIQQDGKCFCIVNKN
ncbi:MAG: hypothetical protein GQ531_11775 [Sulfurovum sp.]|nr:hypothetical protein [Sulfurovum sp.]